MGISDITCDMNGSIELLQKYTNIDNPFYTIDPLTNIIQDEFRLMGENSIIYHAVDHLPAEFAIDASIYFSQKLLPFVLPILESHYPCDYLEDQNNLPKEILNAIETC